MRAFLDESGTNPETPVLSVAGFYGDEDQWATFRRIWKPFSVGFHALRSSGLFPQLCCAIETSGINGILITVSKEKYKRLATQHMKSFVGNPYAVCSFLCALTICKEITQSVSIVLEQGQPNLSFVTRILEVMKDAGDPINTVTAGKKSEFVELHPADFVSHIASSHDVEWMHQLFESGRLKHGHVTEQMLKDAAPQITAIVRRAKEARRKQRSGGMPE